MDINDDTLLVLLIKKNVLLFFNFLDNNYLVESLN